MPLLKENTLTDEELLPKLRNPETRSFAFHQMVEAYGERVYRHIRKIVVSHDDADDLVQETFIKVWNNLDKFRADSKLYTWIYRIATNEALQFLKKKKRVFFVPVKDVSKELSRKLEADPQLSGDRIQLKLQKAILTLPEKQRVVFNMRYFEEMTYKDIAEVLGTSVGALKASYHHARKKIEDCLSEEEF